MTGKLPNETLALQMKCLECYTERENLRAENRQFRDLLEMTLNAINSIIVSVECDLPTEDADHFTICLSRLRAVLEGVGKNARGERR